MRRVSVRQATRQLFFVRQATRRPQLSPSPCARASGDHLETTAILLSAHRASDLLTLLICSLTARLFCLPTRWPTLLTNHHAPPTTVCVCNAHRVLCLNFYWIFLNENACWIMWKCMQMLLLIFVRDENACSNLDCVKMHANASINFYVTSTRTSSWEADDSWFMFLTSKFFFFKFKHKKTGALFIYFVY